MKLAEIHRYPVKSLLGERLQRAEIGPNGIIGDRAWALKDERRGELTSAKRFAALMNMQARFTEAPTALQPSAAVEIHSDNKVMRSDDPDIHDAFSAELGHPVSLWPLLPPEADAHYRREPAAPGTDMDQLLRQVFARTEDEPIPKVEAFPAVLATHHSEPGTYFDAFPLLIITRSALLELERRAHADGFTSNFDLRRFRPNLVIDTAEQGFVEDAWCGRKLKVGTAVLKIEMTCPRCIMTTHGFADLPKDPKVMRALVQQHGGELGVYASVVAPGEISENATVELC